MADASSSRRLWALLVITSLTPGVAAMQWLCVLLPVSILSPVTITAHHSSISSSFVVSVAPVTERQTETVTIDVAVSDKSGKPVRGLQQGNFTLLDDKQTKTLT